MRNPIDSFTLQKLEGMGLEPEPQATPNQLLRRLTLDLTGLPPAPEDTAPTADPTAAPEAAPSPAPTTVPADEQPGGAPAPSGTG